MGSIIQPERRIVDTGRAPEFFVDATAGYEVIAGGNMRGIMCATRGNLLIVRYTNIIPIVAGVGMAQRFLTVAAQYDPKMVLPLIARLQ